MEQCMECRYCYPLKTEDFKPRIKKYACIYNSEAYTHPPFEAPVIPDPYVCSCKNYEERKKNGRTESTKDKEIICENREETDKNKEGS